MNVEILNAVSNLVGSLGFPIFMCVYMMNSNNKTLDKLTNIINDNTTALNNLSQMIINFIGRDKND